MIVLFRIFILPILFFALVACGTSEDRSRDRKANFSDNEEASITTPDDVENELDIQLKKLHTSFSNCQSSITEASENNSTLKKKCLVTNLEQANDAVCESKIRLDTFLRQYSNYKDRTQKIESILDRVRIMESDYKKMISNETGKSYEEIKSIVSDICDIT